jgi:hypothetical protein
LHSGIDVIPVEMRPIGATILKIEGANIEEKPNTPIQKWPPESISRNLTKIGADRLSGGRGPVS